MPKHKDLLHEGKPTRHARVLFVCRELNNDPLTDFLMHDTRALVKLIELFNRVHELETQLSDEQLRAILLKTDSWLMYILQISVDNFHNWTGGDHAKETRITSCSPERQCDGWDVKKDVSTRSSGHFDKKQDTVDAGREISQNQGHPVLHPQQGQPRERPVSAEGMKLLSIRCPIWEPNQSPKIGCEVVAVKLNFEVILARNVASAALFKIIFSAFCLLLQLLRRITDCFDQLQRPLLLVIGQTYHLHTLATRE